MSEGGGGWHLPPERAAPAEQAGAREEHANRPGPPARLHYIGSPLAHAQSRWLSCLPSARPQGPEADEEAAAREEQFGAPKGAPGQWASCLRVVDPATLQVGGQRASSLPEWLCLKPLA